MGREQKDELILLALLSNPTIRKASQACGVSESQIYERLRSKEFKARYDKLKRQMLAQGTGYLVGVAGEAMEKIRAIMNDPEASKQTQLNACDTILRNCLRYTETTDIITALEDLKREVYGGAEE